VRGRAPDDGYELGEGLLLHLGEEGEVRVGGVSESDIIVLSKAFSYSPRYPKWIIPAVGCRELLGFLFQNQNHLKK
jgi:hypothetical protein